MLEVRTSKRTLLLFKNMMVVIDRLLDIGMKDNVFIKK
jgi:hypothetical protein